MSVMPKRATKPSQKVIENYETEKDLILGKLDDIWKKNVHCMSLFNANSDNSSELNDVLKRLRNAFDCFQTLSERYLAFLNRSGIKGLSEEKNRIYLIKEQRCNTVLEVIMKIEHRIADLHEVRSHRSVSSKHTSRSSKSSRSAYSHHSTVSDRLIKARADAEVAKLLSKFSVKEAMLKASQTQMQAERDEAAALARLRVYEEAVKGQSGEEPISIAASLASEDPLKRTRDYLASLSSRQAVDNASEEHEFTHKVQEQSQQEAYILSSNKGQITADTNINARSLYSAQSMQLQVGALQQVGITSLDTPHDTKAFSLGQTLLSDMAPSQRQARTTLIEPPPGLNTFAPPYIPATSSVTNTDTRLEHAPQIIKTERSEMSEFAKYMIRRELISSGLTNFDDYPENYRSWKSTFKTTIEDLGITAKEELDLLVKWLGSESSKHVVQIRRVHVHNSTAALSAAWEILEQTYGSSEVIENALFKRIQDFPKISNRENLKFQELSYLLQELQLAKEDPCLPGLSYLDTAHGVNPVVEKLPFNLQDKWTFLGSKYKQEHHVSFPPFSYFCKFIKDIARAKNDPSFIYTDSRVPTSPSSKSQKPDSRYKEKTGPVFVQKTDVIQREKVENPDRQCPLHKKPHALKKCRGFRDKTLKERKELLQKYGICYRCCASTEHFAKECKAVIKCSECESIKHVSALHPEPLSPSSGQQITPAAENGGEDAVLTTTSPMVSSTCTQVCGDRLHSKSCAKICLVNVHPKGHPEKTVRMYAILDDQSNRSLARSEFFELFNINGNTEPYTLGTCAGVTESIGRRANGFIIASLYNTLKLPLPTLIECNQLPNNRDEIPTREAASLHPHLMHIADQIPAVDKNANILLLLGRDILRVHKVRQYCNGPGNAPYAQRLDLGWVIVGKVCISKVHPPDRISTWKTNVLENGRTSFFKPCKDHYYVKEKPKTGFESSLFTQERLMSSTYFDDQLENTIFQVTVDDNKPAPSIEDKEFIKIMDKEFFRDDSNSWVAPLPFRVPRQRLPNNREQALLRFVSLQRSLKKNPEMREHFVNFMKKIFDNLYRKQWKSVQHLADYFWNRWRKEYLSTLQDRRKWQKDQPNLNIGDLVLLKDEQSHRNEWPMGLKNVFPSDDKKVRKVEVKTVKNGTAKTFTRPITEVILLLPNKDNSRSTHGNIKEGMNDKG
ncbi:uncharacterized protein LOC121394762 [Xenopus laevis]|uniref:Uncharacterized protein LOC121394762 n=1 Tax=Xenopus laevis TaxID=8355 RepID=A0A8J1KYV8_XENLA|nr:uncharacterized protein LOC121394762 [Xenopus laevis]